ncbi:MULTISPECIES: helix-turn-helix domain-containing protein [Corallincola]|uniref:AraC family transcriptional regulator n=2 Tax=Corallincola TaxID=1775176 RepID=A0A368MYF0_9GAMM|nr:MULTISPECIES: AraC family transcriptional regulator [Corallincola]RCU42883.1 AraC family transcriptional regulator [Corallincola holothuriorum]TAA41732.1 AraC family transcriptional regulator [Corallincola spongiicola]
MSIWINSPRNPKVADYVESYWFIASPHSRPGCQYPKLNPHPNAHLILAPDDQPYYYERSARTIQGAGSHWLFPHSQTLTLDHTHAFQMVGIKFHIGATYALNMEPTQPVLDQVIGVDVPSLLHDAKVSVPALLASAARNREMCCDRLDNLLLPWLSQSHQDKHSLLVRKTLPLLPDTPVSQIGELLHCSQRTVERSFSRVTGLTLKQSQSIIKLEAMLEYLCQLESQDIDWVAIAQQFAFSDQSHLIRYLKKELGTTPGEYARRRDFTVDIYGDFDI